MEDFPVKFIINKKIMLIPVVFAGLYEKGETIIPDIPTPVDYLLVDAHQSMVVTEFFE